MKKYLSLKFYCAALFTVLVIAMQAQSLVNMPVTGYNADVVANGVGAPYTSTTGDVDGATNPPYVFIDNTYKYSSGCATGTYSTGVFPSGGTVASVAAPGLTYTLQSSTGNNALRIPSSNGTVTGTGALAVTTPIACSNLYLLCVSGGGAITSGITVTVTFDDFTTQVFSNLTTTDWCNTTNGTNYTKITGTQYNRAGRLVPGLCETLGACQYFAEMTLPINVANYTRKVAGISVSKTTSGQVFSIYAVGASTPLTYYSVCSGTCATFNPTAQASWNTSRTGGGSQPPTNPVNTSAVYVVQGTGGTGAPHNLTFTTNWAPTAAISLQIEAGATVTSTNPITLSSSSAFRIDAGGKYIHNNNTATSTSIFQGTEIFDKASTVQFNAWTSGTNVAVNNSVSASAVLGTTSYNFGNLIINCAGWDQGSAWNGTINLCAGNWTFGSSFSGTFTFVTNNSNTPTVNIGGSFALSGGGTVVTNNNSSGNATIFNIGGDYAQNNGQVILRSGSSSGSATVNVTGNTTVTNSSFGTSIVMVGGSSTAAATFKTTNATFSGSNANAYIDWCTSSSAINSSNQFTISGNLDAQGSGLFKCTKSASATCFVFNGAGTTSSPQTFKNTTSGTTNYTNYTVNTGTAVQLQSNLTLGANNSALVVNNPAGILDCQTYTISGGGVNPSFNLKAGATLITANPLGVTTATGASISSAIANTTFDATASYVFNGTVAQNTGFKATGQGMTNLTINNSAGVTTTGGVTLNFPITITGTLNILNGVLVSTSNLPSVTNNATTAISGGSTTAFIDGPVGWTLPVNLSGYTGGYNFPVGRRINSSTGIYSPFSLLSVTTGATAPQIQVQSISNTSGAAAGTGLSSVSTDEYWWVWLSNAFLTNASVSLSRSSPALGTLNAIGYKSSALTTYTYLGGTVSGTSITGSNLTGAIPAGTNNFALATLNPCTATPVKPVISSITSTTAVVSFSGNSAGTIMEYGIQGFVPGTATSQGTGGSLGLSNTPAVCSCTSPITINGLSPNTFYDVYVRNFCSASGLYISSAKTTFTTASPGGVGANNVLWLKADAGVTTATGVSGWRDFSVNGWNASQATTGLQPVYNTGGSSLLNFNPTITFDGVDDFLLNTTNLANAITSNAVDGYLVGNVTGGNNSNAGAFVITNSGTTDWNVTTNASLFERNNGTNILCTERSSNTYAYNTGLTANATYIYEHGFDGAAPYNYVKSVNGSNRGTTAATNSTFNVNKYAVGCRLQPNQVNYMAGTIAEVILYDAFNGNTSRQKIRSYLAIKYGQTLDQTTPTNYIASNGNVLWDATSSDNATYKNNITVIGRDDASGLYQRQSLSQNNGLTNSTGTVTISKGAAISTTNSNNSGSFTSDLSFVAFGDNGGSVSYSPYTGGTFSNVRMGKTWKVQRTGSDAGSVTIQTSDASAKYLLIYSDAALTSLVSETALSSSVASAVTLTNGQYFTFGKYQTAPGGVLSSTGYINGLSYAFYDSYTATPGAGLVGNVIQTGYINTVVNPQTFFETKRGSNYTINLTGKLQVIAAGYYTFRFNTSDDYAALFINGTLILNVPINSSAILSSSVFLTANSMNNIEVRCSNNGSGGLFDLQYNGADNGYVMGDIPDNMLFTSNASLSLWYKANAGTSPSTDNSDLTTWADQSLNGNDLTYAAGTTHKLYTTTASTSTTGLINFNPSIYFANTEMQTTDNPNGLILGRSSRTMFMVSSKTAGNNNDYAVFHGRDNSTAAYFNFNSAANATSNDYLSLNYSSNVLSSPAAFWTLNGPSRIATAVYDNPSVTSTNNATLFGDGVSLAQATRTALQWTGVEMNDHEDFAVGSYVDAGSNGAGWDGKIPEVIYYPWLLSSTERQKVESYLAIKYGITQGTTSNPVDYISSNGAAIWTGNATYQNNITGIGRDDASALNQTQSKSIQTAAMVTMALGSAIQTTNAANALLNTFASDRAFDAFGDDNGDITTWTATGAPASKQRIARSWKVQEAGTVGSVHIQIPASTSSLTNKLPLVVGQLYLLVKNNSSDFTSGASEIQMSLSGTNWEADVDFTDGDYFTVAFLSLPQSGPGNVIANNVLWLRADVGVGGSTTASSWADLSSKGWGATQSTSTLQPVYAASPLLNFNPTLTFDGVDDRFLNSTDQTTVTGSTVDAYLVANITGGSSAFAGAFSIIQANTQDYSTAASAANAVLFRRANSVNNFLPERYTSGTSLGSTTGLTGGAYYINETDFTGSNAYFQNVNGKAQATGTHTSANFNVNHYGVGCRLSTSTGTPNEFMTGTVAEVILYDANKSTTERQRIRSYLAVKYGQTLDQTTPYDYLASDGTTPIWLVSAATSASIDSRTYKNNITVIGRDDLSLLNQKQSKSQNNGLSNTAGLVTMGLGNTLYSTNAANVSNTTFTFTDKNFEAIGDNGGDITTWTTTGAPLTRRNLSRIWKVKETGTVGSVRIQIPDDGSTQTVKLPAEATGIYIVINSNGNGTNFSNPTSTTGMTLNGTDWEATVNFNDGDYFSFQTQVPIISPTCASQTIAYPAGQISQFGADLATGNTYIFSTCGASENTYIVIYDVDDQTVIASNDDNGSGCSGTAASIYFTPTSSHKYYIAVAHTGNTVTTSTGTLTYQSLVSYPPAYGTTSWNGYGYDGMDLNTYMGPIGSGYTSNTFANLNIDWGSAAPATGSCLSGTNSFSTMHAITSNFVNSYYRFVYATDDGVRISTVGQTPITNTSNWNVVNTWGTSQVSGSKILLLNGPTNIVVEQRDNTGGAAVSNTICQMGGGDLTGYGTSGGAWNVYTYNAGDYTFSTDDYAGFYTTGSSSATSASFSQTQANTTGLRTGACGTSLSSSNQSIRALLSNNFTPQAYSITVGADDVFQLSLDGGLTFPASLSGVYPVSVTATFTLGGVTNLVYQGYNSGSNAVYSVSITPANPVAGTLVSNQGCNGSSNTSITLNGFAGAIQWQTSADGTTWANTGSLTINGTLAVNPSSITYYRAVVNSNNTSVTSNVVTIVTSTVTGNFVVANNTTFGGTINVTGDFTVNSGVTLTVAQGCPLQINATNIIINGTIKADGAGYTGGNGGVGGLAEGQDICSGGGRGSAGIAGNGTGGGNAGGDATDGGCYDHQCGTLCVGSYRDGYNAGGGGAGGGAGGSYGGAAGAGGAGAAGVIITNATGGLAGSAASIKVAYGNANDYTIDLGSGGSGAGGGGGGWSAGSTGGKGGDGGGSVSLIASNSLTISGAVTANGTDGSNGGNGGGRSNDNTYNCSFSRNQLCGGGLCSATGVFGSPGGGGSGAGGGSGGGIKLQAFGVINISGSLMANGGKGGNAGLPYTSTGACINAAGGGGGAGGGRIKIISNPCQNNSISPSLVGFAGGNGGVSGNGGIGNAGTSGSYVSTIIHPSYAALAPGSVVSVNQSICTGGTLTAVDANPSTGGTGSFIYQWYVTKTGCGSPTTGTSSSANNGWAGITANGSAEDLSVAGIQQGMTDVGGGTGSFCFQRRTQSGTCYVWTTAVTITIAGNVGTPTAITIASGTEPSCQLTNGTTTTTYATTSTNNTGFNWSLSNGAAGSINSSGVMTWANNFSGSVNIQVTANGCGGPTSPAVTRTVNVTTTPSVSSSSVTNPTTCGGNDGSIILNGLLANTTYSVSYTHGSAQGPFSLTSIGSVLTIPGLTAGAYQLLTVSLNGCQSPVISVPALNDPAAPAAPVVGSNSPVCTGGSINLTATGQAGAAYSWTRLSGIYTSNQQNPVITNANGGMSDDYCAIQTVANCPSMQACVTVTVGSCGYVWSGAANTHVWGTTGNWLNNSVPPSASTSNVTVQPTTATNYPQLPSNYTLGDITLSNGSSIDLGAFNLDVKGNWISGSGTGAFAIGTGAIILSGGTAQTLSGKTTFNTLRLNNSHGATMNGSAIDVKSALELQLGIFNATGATVTLKSDINGHAIFNDFGATYGTYHGTFTGSINEERYYTATSANSYNQHYMGSPVSNADLLQFGAGGSSGPVTPTASCDETQLDPNSVFGSVFSYDQSIGSVCPLKSWTVVASGNIAAPGKGYSVARTGAGTLTVHGAPNVLSGYTQTGLQNSNWTKGTLQHPSSTAYGSGWQLVSNPYDATLDFTSVTTPQAGFDLQIQIWDVVQGQYFTTTKIAPFQAFFIKKNATAGNDYLIDGTKRVVAAQTFYAQNDPEHLIITATNNSNNLYDLATVGFNPNATDQFDPAYDANKFTGTIGRHNLYTMSNGYGMNKNILQSIVQTSTVNMTFEPGTTGTYTLNFGGLSSFDPTSYITLEDKKLNMFYDVRNGDYTFTSDVADAWDRFILHFTPAAEIATTDQQCSTLGAINITQPGTATWTYTITGTANDTLGSGILNSSDSIAVNVPAGTYTLTLVDNNNYTVVKTITVNGAGAIPALFTPSVTTVETNVDVTFNSTTANAANYYWDFGDGTTCTGQTCLHNYADTGTYTVTLIVISTGGCSSTISQTITVTHTTTGIAVLHTSSPINIWANENRVYIDFSRQTKVDAGIEIYNVLGQQIVNEKFGRSTIYSKPIENLEAAYVVVRVKNDGYITTKRVVIEK